MHPPMRLGKRLEFKELSTGDVEIFAYRNKELYKVAVVQGRQFKRLPCKEWPKMANSDTALGLVQSYAGLHAALKGYSGPL